MQAQAQKQEELKRKEDVLQRQQAEEWMPKRGDEVHVPRFGGDAQVRDRHGHVILLAVQVT